MAAAGERFLARIKATRTDVARVFGFRVNAGWMRENLAHDTREDLAAVRVPVLAVTGDKDLQVDPGDLDEVGRLVPGGADVHRIPDLSHVLRRDPGRHTLRSYPRLMRAPVDAELLDLVTTWLVRRLDAAAKEQPTAS